MKIWVLCNIPYLVKKYHFSLQSNTDIFYTKFSMGTFFLPERKYVVGNYRLQFYTRMCMYETLRSQNDFTHYICLSVCVCSHKGRIVEEISKPRGRSRSPSPKRRYRADYRDRGYRDDYRDRHYRDDYQDREYRRSRSIERYERERYQEKGYRRRSRSISPDYDRRHRKNGPRDERSPRSRSPLT
ncbi:Os03g0388000 [Oryza sativa Japonica Group]|uniref:Arginine/serine-rich splicing factor, putative, expressed n=2 Tax=Oryza sativa subsp. japonica TaxID=39947 RepID=Q6AVF3_ORYSJ|nr:putative splicing factor (having alternative splicing products) [Oryza sativa Japonica Group]ABF96332.1 Arginine/serine-rich splicing factor, putative, expressed [Oryza sativa Japonica Group]BAG88401.1 unnamed protein product [Oryza sativa Japonica Group]BAS84492.1 Os03g0388000 [Oryza sativa Japonica Group]